MRFSLVVGLVAPCCLLTACGSSGPDLGSLQGDTPQEILALATTSITAKASSFHFIDQTRLGKKTTTLSGDDTDTGADQTLSGSGGALEVVRTADGTLFVRGAAGALVTALSLPQATATAKAGQWISLQSGDAPYSVVAVALDPAKELNSFMPTAPLQLESPRRFHGHTVVGVVGNAPTSAGNGSGGIATLYVPTESPYTPVGATLTYATNTGQADEAVVFDNWGKRINPAAPTGAVTYSSLVG